MLEYADLTEIKLEIKQIIELIESSCCGLLIVVERK